MYQNIIQVAQDALESKIPKQEIHAPLERGRGISQAKRHDQEFKQAKKTPENSVLDGVSIHGDLPISRSKV